MEKKDDRLTYREQHEVELRECERAFDNMLLRAKREGRSISQEELDELSTTMQQCRFDLGRLVEIDQTDDSQWKSMTEIIDERWNRLRSSLQQIGWLGSDRRL